MRGGLLYVNSKELHGLVNMGILARWCCWQRNFPVCPWPRRFFFVYLTPAPQIMRWRNKLDQTLLRSESSRKSMHILQVHVASHPATAGKGAGLRDVATSRGFRRPYERR